MTIADPVRLTIDTTPANARAALTALFALDARLEELARHTRDPLIAEMRLTWWYEALQRLDAAPAPAEPLLASIAADVMPHGVRGDALANVASGWEVLLASRPLDDDALQRLARLRGGTLFAAAATVLGGMAEGVEEAGAAWALSDLAASRAEERFAAEQLASAHWDEAIETRWPARLRPLGLLALLSLASRGGTAGGVKAAWRAARFRLTGQ